MHECDDALGGEGEGEVELAVGFVDVGTDLGEHFVGGDTCACC